MSGGGASSALLIHQNPNNNFEERPSSILYSASRGSEESRSHSMDPNLKKIYDDMFLS